MGTITEARARELFGDPAETRRRLQRFSESARILSSAHPRLIDEYAEHWVAVHDGTVRAGEPSLEALLSKLDREGIPRNEVIIRFIDRQQRALIL